MRRRGSSIREYLFTEGDLGATLRSQAEKMKQAIAAYPADKLLSATVDSLVEYFVAEHSGNPLEIDENAIYADEPRESRVDVTGDIRYGGRLRGSGPVMAPGISVSFHIPFTGDEVLLRCSPSRKHLNPPSGRILRGEVVVDLQATEAEKGKVGERFKEQLASIQQHVEWSGADVVAFNATLPDQARRWIEARRGRLESTQAVVADLGFPVRRKGETPATYAVPSVRRKPRIGPGEARKNRPPEPALEMAEYDHILSVCSNMVEVMERSPSAFEGMGEEDLRTHFLVQLNGQYEGGASGETFNSQGKTDILIRYDGKVLFIAECKFWTGPAGFIETVDQLLGYTSWRDSKTAILLFNRNKDFTAVVGQLPRLLQEHAAFVRALEFPSETGCRAVLKHPGDDDRELFVTVLAFDVPR